MRFRETRVIGAVVIEPERHEDERGFFARTWDSTEFAAHGLGVRLVQCSISFNRARGTLRGLHYHAPPNEEEKLVRCTAGSIFDVCVDLRPESETFLRWTGVDLTADNRLALFVPEGCAHGFLTREDDTEVAYQMSEFHSPEAARGVRFDDPVFGISWPEEVTVINDRDASYPNFEAGRP